MRLFIYEWVTAGGFGTRPLSRSLRAEGWTMLAALLEDLGRLPRVRVAWLTSTRTGHAAADRFSSPPYEPHAARPADEPAAFQRLAAQADATLVIAPEFDQILAQRCEQVIAAGGRLLGSGPAAVRLAADKRRLAAHVRRAGVPTPRTWHLARAKACPLPAVCKPRDGAGSQGIRLIRTIQELGAVREQATADDAGQLILQPFVPGLACSVAFLLGPSRQIALAPAAQHLSKDGRFHYRGGSLPLAGPLARRAVDLAGRAVACLPGLRGYVGVDLVLGNDEGGAEDCVIEINPRLTTSYVGLRALTKDNLAGAMLRIVQGLPVREPSWLRRPVTFWPDGRVKAD
jgi:predicted ATP-grasp superfamily ATP-dependent carboligase